MSKFDKIVGYEDIKAELVKYANVLKEPERYSKLGVTVPSGILLYGDPGLGKTLMAKCFIAETGCKTYTLRKEKPDGDFVNQIRETFEAAKKETEGIAIVFLDDMDKFANGDEDHPDAEEYVTVQSCIDECKGQGVFTLATVNNRFCLPGSLLRAGRFDKVIEIKHPEGRVSEAIIKHYLGTKQATKELDTEELAKILEGMSCAEIETVINDAGICAGFEGKEGIEQVDVIRAGMRQMFNAPECVDPFDDKNTEKLAVHEAGHAMVAELLDPGSVALISVCRHSGDIIGITKILEPEGYKLSKDLQEHKIMSSLGGKAATEMVFGTPDVGCYHDMLDVADLVERFSNCCCNNFETLQRGKSSGWLVERKDRFISSEMDRYYQMTKRIIAENREFLDDIVTALQDHKTVAYREMQEIRKRHMV